MTTDPLARFLRWLIALVLIAAGASKLADPTAFLGQILAYRMPMPELFARAAAVVLPWLEVLVGLMLAARVNVRPALAWALMLFFVFFVATGQAWARGLDISCGCIDLSKLGFASSIATAMEQVWVACLRALALLAATLYVATKEPEYHG